MEIMLSFIAKNIHRIKLIKKKLFFLNIGY